MSKVAERPEGPPFRVRDKRNGRVLILQALPGMGQNSHFELLPDTPAEPELPAAVVHVNDDLSAGIGDPETAE